MANHIFVNLPVQDLDRSVAFFTAVGFTFDPRFTDENATCMIVGPNIFVMLLVKPFFKTFTHKEICDAERSTEVLVGLSVDARAEVDQVVGRAVAAGAITPMPVRDHGFMYQHGFQDLDGQMWEFFYMEPSAVGQ